MHSSNQRVTSKSPRPFRCLEHGLTFQTWEAFFHHLKEQHAAAIGDTDD